MPPTANSALTDGGSIHDKGVSGYRGNCVDRTLAGYALVYLVEGGGWYSDDANGRIAVTAGDALVLFPGKRHSYGPFGGPSWSERWLLFSGGLFERLEHDGLLDRSRPVWSPGVHPRLISMFDELIAERKAAGTNDSLVLVAKTHLLISELDRASRERRPLADFSALACARLGEALERPLDLEQIARGFGLSGERFP
jgi:hypothetical protein